MVTHEVLDFLHGELVETHDLRVIPEGRRNDIPDFFLVICLDNHPCAVDSILASPVCVRKEMRSTGEKNMDDTCAGFCIGIMRDLDAASQGKEEHCPECRTTSKTDDRAWNQTLV